MTTQVQRRAAIFGALCALIVVSTIPTWRALLAEAEQHEHYSHVLLIPFVTAGLLFTERKRIFARGEWALAAGVPMGIVGIAAHASATWFAGTLALSDQLAMAMAGIAILWVGAVIACFGTTVFRAGLFPFLSVFLLVPLPTVVLDATISFLLWASTEVTDVLFTVAGTTVYRVDKVFHLPGISIEVARECSGIRSSLALFILSLLAGHLYLKSVTRKTILVLATIPILVLKNGVRIVTLTLLSVHVDPGFLSGPLHTSGGVVFFSLGLLMMWPILNLLSKGESGRTPPAGLPGPQPSVPTASA